MDIVQSLAIIQRVYQVFGLTNLHLDSKSWTLKRSFWQTLYKIFILFAAVTLLSYVLETDAGFNEYIVGRIVYTLELFTVWGAYVFGALRSILHKGSEKEFYEKVREIDGLFKSSLNINIDNRSFGVRALLSTLLLFVFYMATKGLIVVVRPTYYVFWILYMIAFIVCSMRSFQICIAIMILKYRYDKLVSIMRECQNFRTVEMHKLRAIRDLHNRLMELASILKNSSSISLLLNLNSDFIALLSNSFWLYIYFITHKSTLSNVILFISVSICGIPNISNMLILAILCHSTSQCTTEMASSLHRLDVDDMPSTQKAFIAQFSLQLLHQKISFSAAGFFEVDRTLLFTIVGATAKYIIILISFHSPIAKENDS